MSNKFNLVRKGKFIQTIGECKRLQELVCFSPIGNMEFSKEEVDSSWIRIMQEFDEYNLFSTGISICYEVFELFVFCKRNERNTVIKLLAESVFKLNFEFEPNTFMWCVDNKFKTGYIGDWMCMSEHWNNKFYRTLKKEHDYYWLKLYPEKNRILQYMKARKV